MPEPNTLIPIQDNIDMEDADAKLSSIAKESRVSDPVRSGILIGAAKQSPARLTGTSTGWGGTVC